MNIVPSLSLHVILGIVLQVLFPQLRQWPAALYIQQESHHGNIPLKATSATYFWRTWIFFRARRILMFNLNMNALWNSKVPCMNVLAAWLILLLMSRSPNLSRLFVLAALNCQLAYHDLPCIMVCELWCKSRNNGNHWAISQNMWLSSVIQNMTDSSKDTESKILRI